MSNPAAPSLSYIEPEALAEVLKNDGKEVVKVVDVRGEEFQAGHIKGAINYEVSTLQDPKVLDDLVKEVASADKVVVHCQLSLKRGPTAAALLVERLNQLADKRPELAVLRGGFEEFGSKFQDDPSLVEGSGTASAVNGKH